MDKYCFGVDVGGTSIKLGLFTDSGELLEKWSIPTRPGENGKYIYDDIAEAIKTKMREKSLTAEDVAGAGITMPGPIYDDGRLGHAPNIFTIGGYPAREVSERLEGMKVIVVNDANAAALGEMWKGAGKAYSSLCMVTLGTGVGGGVVIKGRIIAGTHGTGGEIGHLKVEPREPEPCNCKGYGCCEQYASATGIVRVAKRVVANGDPLKPYKEGQSLIHPESALAGRLDSLTAKDVCDLAAAGDEQALKALDFSMEKLGLALGEVSDIADPEAYIIGGGVAGAGEFLLDMIRKYLNRYSTMIRDDKPPVVVAILGNDAGMYGAVKLLIG